MVEGAPKEVIMMVYPEGVLMIVCPEGVLMVVCPEVVYTDSGVSRSGTDGGVS